MYKSSRSFRVGGIIVLTAVASASLGWQLASRPTEQQQQTLFANLWMQTSGEYEACCLQTYQLAGDQIEREFKRIQEEDKTLPAASRGLPPAVILDLDETSIDNGTFETYLYDSGQDYTADNWVKFVSDHRASIRMVPGAKEFIERMEAMGITVTYVTARVEALRDATIATLNLWGINTKGMDDPSTVRLLLQSKDSSKEARREAVRAKYRVLALFGDQLSDFSDDFMPPKTSTPIERQEAVYKSRQQFGTKWFAFPNPVYGDWQRLIRDKPVQYLRRAEK
jgi:acid phosphatase